MDTNDKRNLFSEILDFILTKLNFHPKELKEISICSKWNFSTFSDSSISLWRRGEQLPSYNKFKALINALTIAMGSNHPEDHMSIQEFSIAIKNIISKYIDVPDFFKEELTYESLIKRVLEFAFQNKERLCRESKSEINTGVVDNISNESGDMIKGLVLFDLDGTLIKGIKYSWTLLYQAVNISTEKCKINKRKFENGEISYPEWVEYDLHELMEGGLTLEVAQKATQKNCSLTVNFYEAIDRLKKAGYKLGIISGGADVVLYSLIPNADELFEGNIFINKLLFDERDGKLIDIVPTPYDWDDEGKVRGVQGKNEGLKVLCKKYNIPLSAAIFVGDDDNDFKAMRLAGTRILYHSCDPNDITLGTGSRNLPEGLKIITKNNLMLVADIILDEIHN